MEGVIHTNFIKILISKDTISQKILTLIILMFKANLMYNMLLAQMELKLAQMVLVIIELPLNKHNQLMTLKLQDIDNKKTWFECSSNNNNLLFKIEHKNKDNLWETILRLLQAKIHK